MIDFLRRISLSRLLALCAATVTVGAGSTALAVAVTSGPTPPPKPLADAIHAALLAPAPSGVSARVTLVNHLFEGSEIASEVSGQDGNPLLGGGEGRLWIGSEGDARLELQSESGATELVYDHGTVTVYDAANEKLYRYTPPASTSEGAESDASGSEGSGSSPEGSASGSGEQEAEQSAPTVGRIESELTQLMGDLDISGAIPTDVAGEPAYAATVAPKRNAGLFGNVELAWDSRNGVPLRVAVYAKHDASPAVELTVTEISFEAVPASVFTLDLPAGVKETTIRPFHGTKAGQDGSAPAGQEGDAEGNSGGDEVTGLTAVQAAAPFTVQAPESLAGMARHDVRLVDLNGHKAVFVGYGEGLGGIAVIESAAKGGGEEAVPIGGLSLPSRTIDGAKATELPTELGTILAYHSGGVEHLLLGSVTASTIEAAARGL